MVSNWVRELFQAIDRMDPEGFASFLTEDGAFVFGNQQPVRGRAAVAEAVASFFSTIAGLKHQLVNQWNGPESSVVEGRVTYTRKDGRHVTVPFMDVLETRGGKVRDYRIYVDVAPLYAPAVAGA